MFMCICWYEIKLSNGTIIWPKGDAVIGDWRKIPNEEVMAKHLRILKLRKMWWVVQVARMRDNTCLILVENLVGESTWEELGTDGNWLVRTILKITGDGVLYS